MLLLKYDNLAEELTEELAIGGDKDIVFGTNLIGIKLLGSFILDEGMLHLLATSYIFDSENDKTYRFKDVRFFNHEGAVEFWMYYDLL